MRDDEIPDASDAAFEREGERVIAEKLRVLRLVRALDRAGVDPSKRPALQTVLVRMAEYDTLLTSILHVLAYRVDERDEPLPVAPMLQIGEAVRGEVVDALSRDERERVRSAEGQVAASEAEVWMEVDALHRTSPSRGKRRPRGPSSDAEAATLAREAIRKVDSGALEGRPKVLGEERRPLPAPDAPLAAWFERLPDGWRETVARLHDVDASGGREQAAARIARRIEDRAWLARFLVERIGAGGRELLVPMLETDAIPVRALPRELRGAFDVPWDWTERLPPSDGGKLRAAGFVHVGVRGRARVLAVPPALREPLRSALAEVDLDVASLPDRARRLGAAEALDGTGFADAELDRWKRLDRALTRRFERWVTRGPRVGAALDAAVDALFAGESRELRSDAEQAAMFEYVLFDWRASPDAPTLAESRLETERFASEDERSLARATVAACPALYRVAAARRGTDVTLTPVFPTGPDVVVTDRGLSLTAESRYLIGARVYPAGPYLFARLLGDPVSPDGERRLLGALGRERLAHVRSGASDDPRDFVRARPQAILRALRACR